MSGSRQLIFANRLHHPCSLRSNSAFCDPIPSHGRTSCYSLQQGGQVHSMQTHPYRGTGLVFSPFLAGNAYSRLFVDMESYNMWGFLRPASLALHCVRKVPPWYGESQRLPPFSGCVIFHCVDAPHSVYPFVRRRTLGLATVNDVHTFLGSPWQPASRSQISCS